MAWYQHQMNFNENAFCGNEWVLTFTGARDSPGRRLAPVQGHSTELGNTSQTTVNETKLPGIQGFKEIDESMHGSRANPFLLLGHPALATRPIVRMRGQLNVKVNIQDGVKQGTYWKIQGVSAVRQILNGDTMSKGRIWMSVVGVGKVKGVEFPRKYCPDRCHNHSEVSASGLQSPTILVGKYLEVAQTSKLIPYKALFTKYWHREQPTMTWRRRIFQESETSINQSINNKRINNNKN